MTLNNVLLYKTDKITGADGVAFYGTIYQILGTHIFTAPCAVVRDLQWSADPVWEAVIQITVGTTIVKPFRV